jgi:ferredoxin
MIPMPHPVPHVVRADCIHCGTCAQICPQVFQVDKSLGCALIINPRGASPLLIQEAMDNCPVQCLHWQVAEP